MACWKDRYDDTKGQISWRCNLSFLFPYLSFLFPYLSFLFLYLFFLFRYLSFLCFYSSSFLFSWKQNIIFNKELSSYEMIAEYWIRITNNHERLLVCVIQKMTFLPTTLFTHNSFYPQWRVKGTHNDMMKMTFQNIRLKGFSPVKLNGFSPVWTQQTTLQNARSLEVHRAKFSQVSSLACVKSEINL